MNENMHMLQKIDPRCQFTKKLIGIAKLQNLKKKMIHSENVQKKSVMTICKIIVQEDNLQKKIVCNNILQKNIHNINFQKRFKKKTNAKYALSTIVQLNISSSWRLSGSVQSCLLWPPLVRMEPAQDNFENILNNCLAMILRYFVFDCIQIDIIQ